MNQNPLIVIVGPTGVGKTVLSLKIAQKFSGQIVSADSRQIYKLMDIGTAKPSEQDLATVPHHLIDIVLPDYVVTLAEFQERAYKAIEQVHYAGDLPLLVGGTGQWVKAVVEGWGIPRVPPDLALRAKLEAEVEVIGREAFHARLASVDLVAASKIDYRNVRRVLRALEVYEKTGIPISVHQEKSPPPYRILQIGLTMPREQLYIRIDNRINKMIENNLLNEIINLLAKGYNWQLPAMSGLGYKQFQPYLQGEITLDEVVALIKKETRRFIRQQYNWFRLDDERIRWVDVSQGGYEEKAIQEIVSFLSNN